MHIVAQIAIGSGMLVACGLLHIAILLSLAKWIHAHRVPPDGALRGHFRLIAGLFLVVALSHVVQIGLWAILIRLVGALPRMDDAFYFALVSYTTVGYGDVTLDAGYRVLGAMSAITGILAFGLSTALLVAFFTRLFDHRSMERSG